jgi:hypothetical protein
MNRIDVFKWFHAINLKRLLTGPPVIYIHGNLNPYISVNKMENLYKKLIYSLLIKEKPGYLSANRLDIQYFLATRLPCQGPWLSGLTSR